MRWSDSSSDSGSRGSVVAPACDPQPGRTSFSSGRAVQTRRIGEFRVHSAMCSIRSSSPGSAQWMSSKTATSSRSAARASKSLRIAQWVSSGEAVAPASPRNSASRSDTIATSSVLPEERLDPRAHLGGTLRVADPGDRREHLHDRPVRDAVPVGQALAADHDGRLREIGEEPLGQPRLPDAGRPQDRARSTNDPGGAPERFAERLQLAFVRRSGCRARRATPRPTCPTTSATRNASTVPVFPFNVSGSTGSATTASRTRAHRRSADQDLAGRRACSQARSDVDRIARHERLPSVGVAGDDVSGVHADPRCDRHATVSFELLVQGRERVAHLDGRPDRPERVVLVDGGIPNTAITASPMYFSTVPPWRSSTVRISSKKRDMRLRSDSGSSCSPSDVDPVTSQNRTVTVFRTSPPGLSTTVGA